MPVEKSPHAPTSPLGNPPAPSLAANGHDGAGVAVLPQKSTMEQNGVEQNGTTTHPYIESPPRKLPPASWFIFGVVWMTAELLC